MAPLRITLPARPRHQEQQPPEEKENSAVFRPAPKISTGKGQGRHNPQKWEEWELSFANECFNADSTPSSTLLGHWALQLTERRLITGQSSKHANDVAADWHKHYARRLKNWFKNTRARLRREEASLEEPGSPSPSTSKKTLERISRALSVQGINVSTGPLPLHHVNGNQTAGSSTAEYPVVGQSRSPVRLNHPPNLSRPHSNSQSPFPSQSIHSSLPSCGPARAASPNRARHINGKGKQKLAASPGILSSATEATPRIQALRVTQAEEAVSTLPNPSGLDILATLACLEEKLPFPRHTRLQAYDPDVIRGATLLTNLCMSRAQP